jgi:hypothetical protein
LKASRQRSGKPNLKNTELEAALRDDTMCQVVSEYKVECTLCKEEIYLDIRYGPYKPSSFWHHQRRSIKHAVSNNTVETVEVYWRTNRDSNRGASQERKPRHQRL